MTWSDLVTMFKAKNNILLMLTSIKINENLLDFCVEKVYGVKIKMVQEQWLQLKRKSLLKTVS